MLKRNKTIVKILAATISTSLINTWGTFAWAEEISGVVVDGISQGNNLNVENINNSNNSADFTITESYSDVLGVVATTSASVTFDISQGDITIDKGSEDGKIKITSGEGELVDGTIVTTVTTDDELDEDIDIIITGGSSDLMSNYNVSINNCMPAVIARNAYTTGNIEGGNITIEGGSVGGLRGGNSDSGTGGSVTLEGGTVEYIYAGDSTSGTGGSVTIKGGTVELSTNAGHSDSGEGGSVTIEGGTINSINDTNGGGGFTKGGSVTIEGGTVEGEARGGNCVSSEGGSVVVRGGTVAVAYGGESSSGTGGAVIIEDGTVTLGVMGGISVSGTGGSVTIEGGTVKEIYGGFTAVSGVGGLVTIEGGTVGIVNGGLSFGSGAGGDVIIEGGTVEGNINAGRTEYGAPDSTVTGTVTINGGFIFSGSIDCTPKNKNDLTVYKNTVKLPINSEQEVTFNIDNNNTWKATTVSTGEDSIDVYIYLTESTEDSFHTIEVEDADGNIYVYKVTTKTDGTSVAEESIIIKNQPTDINVTFGDISETLNVNAIVSEGKTLNYQWYSNSTESNQGGTLIEGATSEEFEIPADSPLGEKYYYCVVSSEGLDSVTSNAAKVVVAPKIYAITASAGDHGSISPSGNINVAENGAQSFTITPDTGYVINDVKVDGVSVGSVSSYTFENVTSEHTISAAFKVKSSSSGGSSSSHSSNSSSTSNNSETVTPSTDETSIISAINSGTAKTIVINVNNSNIANNTDGNLASAGTISNTPLISKNILNTLKANLDKTLIIKNEAPADGTSINTVSTIEIKATADGQIQFIQNNVPLTGFRTVGNSEYYLNANGIMQTGWLELPGNTWYHLNTETGVKETNWIQENGDWYYLNNTTGAMKTGWLNDNGTWYYLSSNGKMKTGWLQDSDGKWYYLNANGAMAADASVSGYYLGKDGSWVK